MTGYSTKTAHREIALEQHLADRLIASQGYVPRKPEDYDRPLAVDRALALRFVKDTQPDEWRKLEAQYTTAAESEFFKQLEKALKARGTLNVLRQGIKLIPGIKFALCFFRPASGLNTALIGRYEANILSVIRQLYYSQRSENAIDVALFVNGLPVATAELKNRLTGTTFRHAEKQYRDDRSPAGEPLLTFKRGALVHFAMDEDHVYDDDAACQRKDLAFCPSTVAVTMAPVIATSKAIFACRLFVCGPAGERRLSSPVRCLLDIIGRFVHLERLDDFNRWRLDQK